MGVCARIHVHMWGPKVNVGVFLTLSLPEFLRQCLLRTWSSPIWPDYLGASLRDRPVLAPPSALWLHVPKLQSAFPFVLRTESQLPRLHGKHFTNWSISSALSSCILDNLFSYYQSLVTTIVVINTGAILSQLEYCIPQKSFQLQNNVSFVTNYSPLICSL